MYIEWHDSGFQRAVNRMIRTIGHFKRVDVGETLSTWQVEDMHRHRPFTMRTRGRGKAATVIRPHSKYEVQRSVAAASRARRRHAAPPRWSTRPILREELEQRLQKRVEEVATEKIHW